MDALLLKVKDVINSLTGKHVVPPVFSVDPEEAHKCISFEEFPQDVDALPVPAMMRRNPCSRLVVMDDDDDGISIHTHVVGRTMFSDSEGDLTVVRVFGYDRALLARLLQSAEDVVIESKDYDQRFLKALIYSGFLV